MKNPDILKELSKRKEDGQKIVGFSLATCDTIEKAKEKIKNKKCDYIVANYAQTALQSDENEVWVIDKNLNVTHFEKDLKSNIAKKILELIYD